MAGAFGPIPCYRVLVNGTLSRRRLMHLITLLPLKILVAMALAQSLRRSFQIWRDSRVLDQIEPSPGQTFIDDVKMASAVTIAAAIMIPAILAYAFVSWIFRSLSRWPVPTKPIAGTRGS